MNKGISKVQFFDGVTAEDLIQRARGDSDAAKELLIMAAKYIRTGEPMPAPLREYLADAFEMAVNKPAAYDPHKCDTGNALLTALHLKYNHRPTTGMNPLTVCAFMFDEMVYLEEFDKTLILTFEDGQTLEIRQASQTEAAKRAAEKFGISTTTAKRYYRENIDEYMKLYTADPPDNAEIKWLADKQEEF